MRSGSWCEQICLPDADPDDGHAGAVISSRNIGIGVGSWCEEAQTLPHLRSGISRAVAVLAYVGKKTC